MQLKIVCVLVLALGGCKKESKSEAAKADPAAQPTAGATAPANPPPATAAPSGGGGATDHSDPAKVVEQIFAAARSGNTDALAGLCDPAGTGDGDVKSICSLKAGDPTWERFARDFAKGKVDGTPTIEGDTAEVTFLFGRDGTKSEKMNLTRIDGKWYLGSF